MIALEILPPKEDQPDESSCAQIWTLPRSGSKVWG